MFGRMLNLFRRDDAHEFKPALAEIEERPANPLGRIVFWFVLAVMVFFVLWMTLGRVDVVVTARGLVIPDGDVKILQPLDTGVVSRILCREGDYVKKNQVLMEIDPSITAPELESKKKNLQFLEIEKSRLDALLKGEPFRIPDGPYDDGIVEVQRVLHASSLASLEKQVEVKKAELARTEEEIQSAEKDGECFRALLAQAQEREDRLRTVLDIVSRDTCDEAQKEVLTQKNNTEQAKARQKKSACRKREIENEMAFLRENFRVVNLKELSDRQKLATEIGAEIEKTSFRNEKQRILSPVDGYVTNLLIHTVGGVVTPAQKLVTVVPVNTPLIVRAAVLNRDIGFVAEGMTAALKIDAFNFQRYGTIGGTVRNVSKNSVEDERLGPVYEIFVEPGETNLMVEGRKAALVSGMSTTAEIKVGKRRIIEFFIYPLIKYLDEGMKVR